MQRRLPSILYAVPLLGCIFQHSATARLIAYPSTDELMTASTLVCNGYVTELTEPPGAKGEFIARIKVVAVFKGPAVQTVELRYYHNGEEAGIDPPNEVNVTRGWRYRFYLRKNPKGDFYETCITQEADNGFAVKAMADDERDNQGSPDLTKGEAIRIATAYMKTLVPDIMLDANTIKAWFWPARNYKCPEPLLGSDI